MVPNQAPIGFFDSGIGGLSVVREALGQLPTEAILYFGDTARVPYGSRTVAELTAFNGEILDFLRASGAKAVVVACNTSAALAIPALAPAYPLPIFDIVAAGAAAVVAAGRRIGIIATEGTIRSGAYQQAIDRLAPGAELLPVACPALVPLVEAGTWEGAEATEVVLSSLAPLIGRDLDALVLGCTHFPMLQAVIAEVLPGVTLVDPAVPLVAQLKAYLGGAHVLNTVPAVHRFVVSGDPARFELLRDRLIPALVGSAPVERHAVAQPLPVAPAPLPTIRPAIQPSARN